MSASDTTIRELKRKHTIEVQRLKSDRDVLRESLQWLVNFADRVTGHVEPPYAEIENAWAVLDKIKMEIKP